MHKAFKLTEVSHTHIMEIEDGKKAPTFDKVQRSYHVDVQDFLRARSVSANDVELDAISQQRKIPIVSRVVANKGSETGESFHTEDANEWIESDIKEEHNFALRVKGDSTEPEFSGGYIIIVSPTAKAVTGDYVVAKNDEEEATFKQYNKFDSARVLHPLNPKYQDIVLNKDIVYRIVGVVMEKKKRDK